MNSKAFVLLVVAILVLGGGLGGAFAGGVVVGKGQNEETSIDSLPQAPSNQTQTPFDPSQLSQEELDQLREQFQGQRPGGGGTGFGGTGFGDTGFGGRGGLTGTIEGIEGSVVTVNTSQGPLLATVGDDTTIHMTVQGSLEDLEPGVQVTVVGQRGEDGTVQAVTIIILPEDGGLFGGRQFGGG
ncbi:MAG: hypothetical protein O7F09_01070 [Chloroflexi bacterium]|nr:hypothetical protein [Chloroflexota bacterium]